MLRIIIIIIVVIFGAVQQKSFVAPGLNWECFLDCFICVMDKCQYMCSCSIAA